MARLRLVLRGRACGEPAKIIYVGCFGYSQRGPYAAKAAYDDLIQGAAGLPWLLHEAGRRRAALRADDRRRPLGRPAGGERGQRGALLPREDRQGPARRRADVRAPAADRCSASTWAATPSSRSTARRATRACSRRTAGPTRRRTATSARSSTTTSSGRRSSRCIGTAGDVPRSRSIRYSAKRAASNYAEAYAFVAEEMKKRTTAEWIEALERADIPVQRMNSLDDIVADPHLAAIGYFGTRRAPHRGAPPLDGGALGMVRIAAGVPAPRAAAGRAHARGAPRSRAVRRADRRSHRQRRRPCRRVSLAGAERIREFASPSLTARRPTGNFARRCADLTVQLAGA